MTTVDKLLKIDNINQVLQEIKEKEVDIEGLFVVFTTDHHEGYFARIRNFPTHILYGILQVLVKSLEEECLGEIDLPEE